MKTLLFIGISLLLNLCSPVEKIPFIKNPSITIDGNINESIWEKSKKITKNEYQIRCFQDSDNLYVGINNPAQDYVDLYFYLNNDKTLNCHASMQLGERIISKSNLNPSFSWGNNRYWVANSISQKQLNNEKPTCFEFKIAKKKIGQDNFKLKIVSANFFDEKKKTTNTVIISL